MQGHETAFRPVCTRRLGARRSRLYDFRMAPDPQTAPDLDQLRGKWLDRLDENIVSGSFAPSELNELARRYRTLAEAAESRGQRRAALTAADRFERAARQGVSAG